MSGEINARTYLEDVVLPELRAEGFEVFLYPKNETLPVFLRGYQPDAIAIRPDKKYVVEVKQQGASASASAVERLRALVLNQPGWELKVYFVSPAGRADDVPVVPLDHLRSALLAVELLNGRDEARAGAFLLAWAAFEGISRSHYPDYFARPQTPGRIVETLANRGDISTRDAAMLREFATRRNRLIHGQVDLPVSRADVENFVRILTELLNARVAEGSHRLPEPPP